VIKRVSEARSGVKAGMVVGFYLLTFVMSGLFLFVGGRLGFVVELTATLSYIVVTVLFYALSKNAQ
jgi:hypothetical protein